MASGSNFFPIKAKQKVAVDPKFNFSKIKKMKWSIKNTCNIAAKYYEINSDRFFESNKKIYNPDVVFIDGLHTYAQSLIDVNNSLKILEEDGVIIMHDCNPPHEAAAHPANSVNHAASLNLPGWTGVWCGDVWKTICHLRSIRNDLLVFVLDCDYGLGIITKGEPENDLNLSEEEIHRMEYGEFAINKAKYLNLKDDKYLFEFLKRFDS